jgi:dihydroorotate dehydrogenase
VLPLASATASWFHRHLGKPLYFALDAELVHVGFTQFGKALGHTHLTKKIVEQAWAYNDQLLQKKIDGIVFPNPVGLAAGFDYEGELTQILPNIGFGFHTIGTVTFLPYEGNVRPRLSRLPNSRSLIINKGLKNLGALQTVNKLTKYPFRIPTGISIASTNKHFDSLSEQIEDITNCFRIFEESHVQHSYYELNISCPNTFGGQPFTDPTRLKKLLSAVRKLHVSKPIYVKFPIDHSDAESLELLHLIVKHQMQGVILGNLTKDKKNPDIVPADREIWKKSKGNLSGKPTWNRSNHLIALTRKEFGDSITIIGTGGIFSGKDAFDKISLGADLVQLITGMVYEGPQLIGQINHYLATH